MATISAGGSPIVTLFISSEDAKSERRFNKSLTILDFKEKLEPISGCSASTMSLFLYSNNTFICELNDDNKMLGYYSVCDFMTVEVKDTNPHKKKHEFSDVSAVEKFEITQEEYEKRTDSVLYYKMKHKIGRFADASSDPQPIVYDYEQEAMKIKIDDRCQVEMGENFFKKGIVTFVGKTEFKPGYWIGIRYDEPLGKHNGTVAGVKYFECPDKYGGFVRPNKVQCGDYPEDDLMDDEF